MRTCKLESTKKENQNMQIYQKVLTSRIRDPILSMTPHDLLNGNPIENQEIIAVVDQASDPHIYDTARAGLAIDLGAADKQDGQNRQHTSCIHGAHPRP